MTRRTDAPRLGSHMSIAGGLHRAVDRAAASGCQSMQIFTKSVGQWRARPLLPDQVSQFRARVTETGLRPVLAHNSYLINVAAASRMLREKSVAALVEELDRAETLGLDALVMHPGAYTAGTEQSGLELVAGALRQVLRARPRARTMVLLEHTAGQGTCLGHRFEHLASILERLEGSSRVGVCLDTCHLLAAGYDIASESGYRETLHQFDRLIGLDRLKAFHMRNGPSEAASTVTSTSERATSASMLSGGWSTIAGSRGCRCSSRHRSATRPGPLAAAMSTRGTRAT